MKSLPLIPIHEDNDLRSSILDSRTWYFLAQEDALDDVLASGVSDVVLFESVETAAFCRGQIEPNGVILSTDHRYISESLLMSSHWKNDIRKNKCVGYRGYIHPGSISIIDETEDENECVLTEGVKAKQASNARLKRVVQDALNKSKAFKSSVKDITVKGNKMTVKLDKDVYLFEIDRDKEGWVQKVKFLAPRGKSKEVSVISRSVSQAFKAAGFQQILEDAASSDPPRLVMLDYTRVDGGRRTRLSEPYSFRFNPQTHKWYYYGWNAEEGGIRSYIVDNIEGARLTDIEFQPRFLVEIGKPRKDDPSMDISGDLPAVVTKGKVRRAHKKFDLKGGYGKIVKRLGHSVPTPKQQAAKRAEQKATRAKQKRISNIKKRSKSTSTRRRRR